MQIYEIGLGVVYLGTENFTAEKRDPGPSSIHNRTAPAREAPPTPPGHWPGRWRGGAGTAVDAPSGEALSLVHARLPVDRTGDSSRGHRRGRALRARPPIDPRWRRGGGSCRAAPSPLRAGGGPRRRTRPARAAARAAALLHGRPSGIPGVRARSGHAGRRPAGAALYRPRLAEGDGRASPDVAPCPAAGPGPAHRLSVRPSRANPPPGRLARGNCRTSGHRARSRAPSADRYPPPGVPDRRHLRRVALGRCLDPDGGARRGWTDRCEDLAPCSLARPT